MECPFYLVDAFSHAPFTGNPAGVCLLESEPEESWMQQVAMEINQAETAFAWPIEGGFGLRWFTPTIEVDLCGHATLATTHILVQSGAVDEGHEVRFFTKSGKLTCFGVEGAIHMDFPAQVPEACTKPEGLAEVFPNGVEWVGTNAMDWFVEVRNESAVLDYDPNFEKIRELGLRGIAVTARGENIDADFVSRFFAPTSGVPEDHVTGSAHCALAPYWAAKLGQSRLRGYQASPRGGFVGVEVKGTRVILTGRARAVVTGQIRA